MKLKVYVLDLEIPKSIKRRALLVGIPLATLLAAGVALATVPHTFANGQVLNATDLNDNFTSLDARLTALEAKRPVAKVGTHTYSLDAKYCGKTAPTTGAVTSGALAGWAAVKDLCQTACSSPSAHMCTGNELLRSAQLGVPTTNGAYAAETAFLVTPNGASSFDCQGYTTASPTVFGYSNFTPIWFSNPDYPSLQDYCNASHPLLCCD